jgi:UDP-N-acetylglucosamine 2-epimerase (non-hydrolysing)
MKKKILIILGTRPEAIKFSPIIDVFKKSSQIDLKICTTGQHREMLDQVLNFFNIKSDYDLDLMTENQSLSELSSQCILKLAPILESVKPDVVFVQGDTTTAFLGALSAFYFKTKVAYVESGLRSHNLYSPFPEEGNRKFITAIADYHFVPTQLAKENLLSENIPENKLFLVGNTVVDALLNCKESFNDSEESYRTYFNDCSVDFNKPIILVTVHRRESFGAPFSNICEALKEISSRLKNTQIIYPIHLNPIVRDAMSSLSDIDNIKIIEPLTYPHMIYLMSQCKVVLTDSGGIQEEAPTFGKPLLVLRDVTERTEGITSGVAKLVGTDQKKIVESTVELMTDDALYKEMSQIDNPYGDGTSSRKIFEIIMRA